MVSSRGLLQTGQARISTKSLRIVGEEGLTIPHPRLAERPFVLAPLAEIAADARHPVEGKTIAELLAAAGTEGVESIAEAGWAGLEGMAAELRL